MKLLDYMDLEFDEWSTDNPRGGLVDKWVRVRLIMNDVDYDITQYVIKAYDFNTPSRGKNKNKLIVNYNCYGFYLNDCMKEAIRKNKKALIDILIEAFERDEVQPFKGLRFKKSE